MPMELRQHQYCSDRRNSTPRKPLATHDQGCMAARWGSTPHDDAALGSLRIDEGCFILGLPDDATEYVLLAAREHGQLGALSTACQRFCALARGRIPANIHIEDAADACKLLQLQLGGVSRPPFSHCDSLYLAAEDAPAMYQLQGVLGTAAAQWTALTSLDLTILPPEALAAAGQAVEAAVLAQYDCSAAGFLMHLAGLKQLQRLKLTTVILGPLTAIQLGRCQALTSLLLHEPGWDEPFLFPTPPDLSPLSSISRLVDLSVVWEGGPKPPAAADGPYALPSSLRVLRVTGDTAYWLQHLPGCPHLEQLALDYGGYQHASAHPAAVLQAAAKHTPGLRSATFFAGDSDFDQQLPMLPNVTCNWQQPMPSQASVAALTALQHLEVGGHLVVGSAADWEALASLAALTSIKGIVVCVPPPRFCRHPKVLLLREAQLTGMTGRGAGQALLAFPALQWATLHLEDVPDEEAAHAGAADEGTASAAEVSRQQQGVQRALSSLASLELHYHFHTPSQAMVLHAGHILAAASCVLDLIFKTGAPEEGSLKLLPDLSACTALTSLNFRCFRDQSAAEDVLAMLEPLGPTLRVLELDYMWRVTPKAALSLQTVLPHLEHVYFRSCGKMAGLDPSGGTEEEQLARLRQQLRPGLTLSV